MEEVNGIQEEPRNRILQARLYLDGGAALLEVIKATPIQGPRHPYAALNLTVVSIRVTLQADAYCVSPISRTHLRLSGSSLIIGSKPNSQSCLARPVGPDNRVGAAPEKGPIHAECNDTKNVVAWESKSPSPAKNLA